VDRRSFLKAGASLGLLAGLPGLYLLPSSDGRYDWSEHTVVFANAVTVNDKMLKLLEERCRRAEEMMRKQLDEKLYSVFDEGTDKAGDRGLTGLIESNGSKS